MLRRFSTNFAVFSIFFDVGLIAASLWGVVQVRPYIDFLKQIDKNVGLPWVLYLVFPLVWVLIMLFFSVYDGSKNVRVVDEFTSLTMSGLLSGITLAGILYLSYRDVSRGLFVFFVLVTYAGLLLWRVAARMLYHIRQEQINFIRHVLIVGAGEVGREVSKRIEDNRYLHIKMVGYLDDSEEKQVLDQVLGRLDSIRHVIQSHWVSDVVIALPQKAYVRIDQMVAELHDLPVRVWVVPDYFHLALHRAQVSDLAGIPMLDLRAPALSEYQRLMKRLFDVVVSVLALSLTLPLMVIAGLSILIDDGFPILFRQNRVGENGHIFTIWKFRTMRRDAEKIADQVTTVDEQGNLIHKSKNDPRITRIGHFLRRFSIDELPQLFNVLRGTMSLVGPRPEMPHLVEKYQPWQRKRFAVPQGITGWWQINGRSDKPMHLHTDDDLYYVQNYSFSLDLQILIKTVWIVLRGKGAY